MAGHIYPRIITKYFSKLQKTAFALRDYGKVVAKYRQNLANRFLTPGTGHKGKPFEQMHILFIIEQRSMQAGQNRFRVAAQIVG